mgnify:CR=1 FL=1
MLIYQENSFSSIFYLNFLELCPEIRYSVLHSKIYPTSSKALPAEGYQQVSQMTRIQLSTPANAMQIFVTARISFFLEGIYAAVPAQSLLE